MSRPIETMTAAEAQFFRGEPVNHILAYEEAQRCAERQRLMRRIASDAARHDPRWPRARH